MQSRIALNLGLTSLLFTLAASQALAGVSPPPSLNSDGSPVTALITARFDPSGGVVPFPTNLLLQGTTDLTLNIPVANRFNYGDPAVAMNALDGFSTVAPWSTTFSVAPKASSVVGGQTVRVFEVELTGPGGGVKKIVRELASPQEFVAVIAPTDPTGKTLAIVPTAPLRQLTSYMAVLLGEGGTGLPPAGRVPSITDATGNDVTSDQTYFLAKRTAPVCINGKSTISLLPASTTCALEPLRQLVASQEAAAATVGIDRGHIVLSWVATTQSTTVVLQAVNSVIDAVPDTAVALAPTGLNLSQINAALPPVANVYVGALNIPYYLTVPNAANQTGAFTGFWHAAPGAYVPPFNALGLDPTSTNVTFINPFPVATAHLNIPVLMTVPNANSGHTKPASGWPIVIFQHGITRQRTDMFAIAGAMAAAGFAVVAIDLPLHGITDPTNPLYRNQLLTGTPAAGLISGERTFDLDFQKNDTGAGGPDGKIDPSGSYFINLTSLLTSRDNLREGVADLLELRSAIPSMSLDGGLTPAFDTARIAYIGQSLGSIEGATFMAVAQTPNTYVQNAVLNVPGGGVVGLLIGSPTFGPIILGGLAGAGVVPGTPAFGQFVVAAQTVIDSGDPINFAFATANKNILAQEVVGGSPPLAGDISASKCSNCYDASGNWLPDQVIPNAVSAFPLSGGNPLIAALGLTSLTSSAQSATGIRGVVRFVTGTHGSLLDPSTSPQATVEMQTEAASFLATGGAAVQITNPAVIKH
ncbi:MAG TPA: hypothetical protein VFI49_10595 [Rudaea sp.]|nr:hypothetical protein [Rudaea sp.]